MSPKIFLPILHPTSRVVTSKSYLSSSKLPTHVEPLNIQPYLMRVLNYGKIVIISSRTTPEAFSNGFDLMRWLCSPSLYITWRHYTSRFDLPHFLLQSSFISSVFHPSSYSSNVQPTSSFIKITYF